MIGEVIKPDAEQRLDRPAMVPEKKIAPMAHRRADGSAATARERRSLLTRRHEHSPRHSIPGGRERRAKWKSWRLRAFRSGRPIEEGGLMMAEVGRPASSRTRRQWGHHAHRQKDYRSHGAVDDETGPWPARLNLSLWAWCRGEVQRRWKKNR